VGYNGRGLLGFCLLLPLLLTGASWGQTISVWYSRGNADAKAIDSQYRQPLHTFDGKDLLLVHGADKITAKTCAQYLDAIGRGYSAANNFENKKEAVFVETCFTLNYVKQVRQSSASYFPGQGFPSNLLDLLPLVIQAGVELHEDEGWLRQDPSLALKKSSARNVTLEDNDYYYTLSVELAGDLNGGGIEDLAGLACMNAKQGTFLFCKTFAITRCGPDKPMTVISENTVPHSIAASGTCATAKGSPKRPKRP
jgi:hypothetical protein